MRRFLILAAGLLASCGQGRPPAGKLAFGPAQPVAVRALAPRRGLPTVTLLDAGREPRRVLRYHPTVGFIQKVRLSQKTRAPLLPIVTSDIVTRSAAEVKEVTDAEVRVRETLVIENFGMPGAGQILSDEQKQLMTGIGEWHLDVKLDPQGRTEAFMNMSLASNMVTVLPTEAVGPGARWRVSLQHAHQLVTDSNVVYELVGADGDQLTIKSATTISAVPQRLSGPVEINGMTVTGTGEQRIDLAHVMPTSDRQQLASDMILKTPDDGEIKVSSRSEVTFQEE